MCWRNYPLNIRFNGGYLCGVPVCEFSTTLAALQRMVCRAYMFIKKEQALQEDEPVVRTGMSQEERLHYTLRLAAKKWFSNTYCLDWLYKGPVENDLIEQRKEILVLLHQALKLYIEKSKSILMPQDRAGRLAFVLYNDVFEISNRIGQVGGIESIEVGSPKLNVCVIDKSVDEYVDSLHGETFDGDMENLSAVVVAPRTSNRKSATVKSYNHQVKLITEDESFTHKLLDKILEVLSQYPDPRDQPRFIFPGTQRFRIGHDPDQFPEFVLKTPVSLIQYATPSGQTGKIKIP